jgi:hypothetical protein
MRHFLTSLINSGAVTVLTSLAMTFKNTGAIEFAVWLPNWLISWSIVCTYVYFAAPKVLEWIHERHV